MICFEVTRNNTRLCTAGLPEGLLSADLIWSQHTEGSGSLYVGAVTNEKSVEWVRQDLSVGDLVSFRVVEAAEADPPHPSPPHDAEWVAACELELAREQHAEYTRRLHTLEARWGPRLERRDA